MSAQSNATFLPLDQLRIDEKANVRKIGRGAEQDMIASIKAIGIRQPLIVRKNGKGYVVADGGKRLEAAQALVKSGDWKADAPIPVMVTDATDAEARELSLALNLVRSDMHPVDAYRAFAALHTDKTKPLDVDAIATRFGIETKRVRQRLALGALDDSILDAWLSGEIREDAVEAFTMLSNKKEQAALFAKLKKGGRLWEDTIRSAINKGKHNLGKLIAFVGREAYEAKGGKITEDLFGDNHIVSDGALLQKMAEAKVKETAEKLKAEGWAWVETDQKAYDERYRLGQLESRPTMAEKQQIATLKRKIDQTADLEDFDANEATEAELTALEEAIAKRVSPEQKAKAGCFVLIDRHGDPVVDCGYIKGKAETTERTTSKSKSKGEKKKKAGPATLTQAMRDRLDGWRRSALQAALVAHPHAQPLAQLLAAIVTKQMRPVSRYNWGPYEMQGKEKELIEAINPKVMNAALRKEFDAKAYFEGCGKAFCLAAITEAVNADEARKIAGKKRGEIAKFALANVGKTNWLPKELRTSHYDGPQAKGKAKSKK